MPPPPPPKHLNQEDTHIGVNDRLLSLTRKILINFIFFKGGKTFRDVIPVSNECYKCVFLTGTYLINHCHRTLKDFASFQLWNELKFSFNISRGRTEKKGLRQNKKKKNPPPPSRLERKKGRRRSSPKMSTRIYAGYPRWLSRLMLLWKLNFRILSSSLRA